MVMGHSKHGAVEEETEHRIKKIYKSIMFQVAVGWQVVRVHILLLGISSHNSW